jgi:hypothetical protein
MTTLILKCFLVFPTPPGKYWDGTLNYKHAGQPVIDSRKDQKNLPNFTESRQTVADVPSELSLTPLQET